MKSLTKDKNHITVEHDANVGLQCIRFILRLLLLLIAPHLLIELIFSKSKRVSYFNLNRRIMPITLSATIRRIFVLIFFPVYLGMALFRFMFRTMTTDEAQSNPSHLNKSKSKTTIKKLPWLETFLVSIFFGLFGVDRFIMGHLILGLLKLTLVVTTLFISFNSTISDALYSILCLWQLSDIVRIGLKSNFNGVKWIKNNSASLNNKNNPFMIS